MEFHMSCRLCAGIADPGVSLIAPGKQTIARWIENNLGYAFDATNGFPTNVCYPCLTTVNSWILFVQRYKKSQIIFKSMQKSAEERPSPPQEEPEEASTDVKTSPLKKKIKTENSAGNSSRKTLLDNWLVTSKNKDVKITVKTEVKEENDLENSRSMRNRTQVKKEPVVKPEIKSENESEEEEKKEEAPNPKDMQKVRQALNAALLTKVAQVTAKDKGVRSGRVTKKRASISKVKKEPTYRSNQDEDVEEITLE